MTSGDKAAYSSGQSSESLQHKTAESMRYIFHAVCFIIAATRINQSVCRSIDRSLFHSILSVERTRSSADADNALDALVGQSRSTNISGPFQVK